MSKVKRSRQFTFWLRYKAEDCGIMQPPLNAQLGIDFLRDYLLGEDWYAVNPINTEQCNAEIVHQILMKYSKQYRKEYFRELKRLGKLC